MNNEELLKFLFKLQDHNKELKLNATNEEQLESITKMEKMIDDKLKNIYIWGN